MANLDTGSTVPRRQLGRELRRLREEAGVTVQAIATELEWSGPRIWRIETGKVAVRAVDVRLMCEVYRADEAITGALMALAKETRAKGWWHAYGDAIPAYFELYVGLEAAAAKLRTYDPELIHGLFQAEEYASEVFRVGNPRWSGEEVARAVALRMRRQRVLQRPVPAPLEVEAVINEAALLRACPGQRRRLLDIAELPNVTLRLLPLRAGVHMGAMASGAFTIMDFPVKSGRPTEPSTVYCADGLTGALYLDQPKELDVYESIWEGVVEASLPAGESRAYISKLGEEQP